jgi:FtsP/CotA-like multicopper oxidase with cupredoxin domain
MTNRITANDRLWLPRPAVGRRRFLEGLVAGGVLFGGPAWIRSARGQAAAAATGSPSVLTGSEFELTIAEAAVNFTGLPRMATTINGSIPGPTLHWREGDTVTLRVTNLLSTTTSLHWHGILLPFEMDGVPGISFAGIEPGETFTYRFPVRQSGTYWYHSHSGFQEQTGMYGAIVIDPADGPTICSTISRPTVASRTAARTAISCRCRSSRRALLRSSFLTRKY